MQRLERGLEWITPQLDAELSNRLSNTLNPLFTFFDVHHVKPMSMLSALATVGHHAKMSKEELDVALLGSPGNFFGHTHIDDYYPNVVKGRDSLEALRDIVRQVDEAGWPQNAQNPEKET